MTYTVGSCHFRQRVNSRCFFYVKYLQLVELYWSEVTDGPDQSGDIVGNCKSFLLFYFIYVFIYLFHELVMEPEWTAAI